MHHCSASVALAVRLVLKHVCDPKYDGLSCLSPVDPFKSLPGQCVLFLSNLKCVLISSDICGGIIAKESLLSVSELPGRISYVEGTRRPPAPDSAHFYSERPLHGSSSI